MTVAPYPVLSEPATRLLLLTSRQALAAPQAIRAAELAGQVGAAAEWGPLIGTAQRKFSLPMVWQNLAGCAADRIEPPVQEAMRILSLRQTAETLRRQAAFGWYHEACVAPLDRPHAYFKGPALAFRFHAEPGLRHFRDIDILVRDRDIRVFTLAALAQGCRIWLAEQDRFIADTASTEFEDYIHLMPTVQILTPQALMVELHRQIDPHLELFDTPRLLADPPWIEAAGHRVPVLPDAPHVAYLFYHHSRHMWNKLHWLADLDAICGDRTLDMGAVRAAADAAGLRSTLEAALQLHEATAAARLPGDFASDKGGDDRIALRPGIDLLRVCIQSLPGEKELEIAMRRGQFAQSLGFAWQGRPRSRWRMAWLTLRQLARPSFQDIRHIPGGERLRRLRHVAAHLPRMGRILRRMLKREGGP